VLISKFGWALAACAGAFVALVSCTLPSGNCLLESDCDNGLSCALGKCVSADDGADASPIEVQLSATTDAAAGTVDASLFPATDASMTDASSDAGDASDLDASDDAMTLDASDQ
jgi:hypothetical protein